MKKIDPREGAIVSKADLFMVFDYIMLMDEKKDYEQSGIPRMKNHIWLIAKRLMKEAGYKG